MTKIEKIGKRYKITEYFFNEAKQQANELFNMTGLNLLDVITYVNAHALSYSQQRKLSHMLHYDMCHTIWTNKGKIIKQEEGQPTSL